MEYFICLLISVEKNSRIERIFEDFKTEKDRRQLGESRYKKNTVDPKNLSKVQEDRYKYTLRQVIAESTDYDLVMEKETGWYLTSKGMDLLRIFKDQGLQKFYRKLIHSMEARYNAFRYLTEFLYEQNPKRSGLLVFPSYSPRQLGFKKSNMIKTGDVIEYSERLVAKLEEDIAEYLNIQVSLSDVNGAVLKRLRDDELIGSNPSDRYRVDKYNSIAKRFRDFWSNYFLQELYRYPHSMSSFLIWMYRGKQFGVFHVSEFYPTFSGQIVYPLSIVKPKVKSGDFDNLFIYEDSLCLYSHSPVWTDTFAELFTNALVEGYVEIRKSHKNYFINLTTLRELVCYRLKISESGFENFLNRLYKLNLENQTSVKISLEVDKSIEDMKSMYLKRQPVLVEGKLRNIIAIDFNRSQ